MALHVKFDVLVLVHSSNSHSSNSTYIEIETPHDLKGRPIVAGCNSPTSRLSTLLDKILSPIATKVKTYVKDDWHFLRLIPQDIKFSETTLYSVDISSLYTSINHDLGLEAISFWLVKHQKMIPKRFTKDFIIDSLDFVLKNNNFLFNDVYYNQLDGTAMGTTVAPAYACLVIAYLEENKLFPDILPKYFTTDQCKWLQQNYKRYMDDGFVPLSNSIQIEVFLKCLNSLHPMITYTYEKATFITSNKKQVQALNFLDINVTLDENNNISTDVYYKPTNAHEYLHYDSNHPEHTKNNIPYNLAKRILCFVSDSSQEKYRLKQLRHFLLNRNYPEKVINKAFFNARLQGPAPKPTEQNNLIPLVTTNYSNFKFNNIIKETKTFLQNTQDQQLRNVFSDTNIILSQRQPNNLLKILSKAKFSSKTTPEHAIKKCNDIRCNICCKNYLQCTTEFNLSNGKVWNTRTSNLTCNAKNVIYYLKCNQCDDQTYIGKTNNLRLRTNQHISTCRTGRGTDKFDAHVFNCKNTPPREPYFKLFIMMQLPTDDALLTYEKHFHRKHYDTLNSPKTRN